MDYTKEKNRIDLDKKMNEINKSFPLNDDDTLLYIRSKKSTEELFMANCGKYENIALSLYAIASQHEQMKAVIINVYENLRISEVTSEVKKTIN